MEYNAGSPLFFQEKWPNFTKYVRSEIIPLLQDHEEFQAYSHGLECILGTTANSAYMIARLSLPAFRMQIEARDLVTLTKELGLYQTEDNLDQTMQNLQNILGEHHVDKLWRYLLCFLSSCSPS